MGGGAEPKSRPSRLAFHHRQCPHETETFVSKDSCLTEYYPSYLVVGRFAAGNGLYNAALASGAFREVMQDGRYTVYERIRE